MTGTKPDTSPSPTPPGIPPVVAKGVRRWGAGPVFGMAAFLESVFEPVLIDVLMTALAGLEKGRVKFMVLCGAMGSTAGAAFTILLTHMVMSTEAALILMERFGAADLVFDARGWLQDNGILALAIGSLTAVPFFLVVIALTLAGMPALTLLAGAFLFRGLRFAIMGVITHLILKGTLHQDRHRDQPVWTPRLIAGAFWTSILATVILGFGFVKTFWGL